MIQKLLRLCGSSSLLLITIVGIVGIVFIGCATSQIKTGVSVLPFESQDANLKINILHVQTESEFLAEVERRQAKLSRLFERPIDPYFGRRELSATCDETKLPAPVSSQDSRSLSQMRFAFSNEAHVTGLCSEKTDILKVSVLWIYCRNRKSGYEIRSYVPASKDWVRDLPVACP